jgi:hypothetical protein
MIEQIKSFMHELGGMFDFTPKHVQPPVVVPPDVRTDREKMVADWENVGRDLRKSFNQYRSTDGQG